MSGGRAAHRGTDKIGHMTVVNGPTIRRQVEASPDKIRLGKQIDLDWQIVKIRKLLRSTMSVEAIAEEMGVTYPTIVHFIKRRNLCNLKERRRMNTYVRHGGDGAKV